MCITMTTSTRRKFPTSCVSCSNTRLKRRSLTLSWSNLKKKSHPISSVTWSSNLTCFKLWWKKSMNQQLLSSFIKLSVSWIPNLSAKSTWASSESSCYTKVLVSVTLKKSSPSSSMQQTKTKRSSNMKTTLQRRWMNKKHTCRCTSMNGKSSDKRTSSSES